MLYNISEVIEMKYQYNLNNPSFRVCDIDIQRVSRPLGYRHTFKAGRAKHGFVYTVKGRMQDVFYEDSEELISARGELVFIPKGCVYTGIYLDEETEIKIVQFDVSHGELPEYLEKPTKLTFARLAVEIVHMQGGERCRFFYRFHGCFQPF